MTTNFVEYNDSLFRYLDNSPTAFHAVAELRQQLLKAHMTELFEHERWQLDKGKGYFVIRENGALVAFILGSKEDVSNGFRMVASHSDSPCLQLKPRADVHSPPYLQLGVEIYGGPLLNPWFDRDLSLAGRLCCVDATNNLVDYLIDFNRPLLTIPSLAIHFDREANNGRAIDKQKALPPLLAQILSDQLPQFHEILSVQLLKQYPGIKLQTILGFDLFCYDHQKATTLGLNNEFIASGRLDNLLSCHTALQAITEAGTDRNSLFLCTNHEENGSTSTTGANGAFIDAVFSRLAPDPELRQISLRNSFLISIDNAHAVHPNFRDKSDSGHDIILNGGPVIKINANQRYATNSRSASLFKLLAAEAEIPVQEFVMRTDMPCGSTIGPMTAARLGVETIDVGAPTLGMHSIRELTGSNDPYLLYKAISTFFATENIHRRG
ncbi:M18 family aminopeptidase [Desulfopila aestuarii]|uniref:M18 family aminopeptidase n=1 Tax=Desulfopila aestuarii DSM 18488 TaxID=1121416 RepID=A0A1M7Y193_9BACT|nr:M18 family aminopeptidase [Desulfopila aestuarii]SHO45477.1 aspartyl aminopeptidase [Desulfopila aestuarii DSM 18488]